MNSEIPMVNDQSHPTLAAIVLAAGMSRRMGQPKMLLPWGGTTVLGQVTFVLAEALSEAAKQMQERMAAQNGKTDDAEQQVMPLNTEIVVVTGSTRKLVEAEVARLAELLPVRSIFNAQYETGEMMSSIRAGLAGLGPQAAATLIALGDQPQLSLESARRILSAWETSGARLVIPSFRMRRGHPWLVRRELWSALAAARTAREFLNARADEIFYVECDESVLKDLDTPEDYERDLKSAG